MTIGILLNIGSIFYFKYLNFFVENFNKFVSINFELKNILLPLGISFFTFQQISFLVDSYRGETKDYHFLEYATFVSFFPQLVAGPIVLHSELISQFRNEAKHHFNHDSFAQGIYTFSIGLFKKVLIADTFGKAVSWGMSNISELSSLEIILVMISYTYQIYFDFSGYSDMAIGLGKMFNLDLPINFNSPYKARSIIEFWKRWHMSLTRFLRNYVYFPLGGNRHGNWQTCCNIMIVFLISGIWHGANWTFILWGILHGLSQILNRLFKRNWEKWNPVLQWLCTFSFVNIMWLIFRADSVNQAFAAIKKMLKMDSFNISSELIDCFKLEELNWMISHIKPISLIIDKMNGFYMWLFLLGSGFICLNLKNLHEDKFKPTIANAVITAVFMVWSITSFADVSTFLYFNF